MKKTLLKIIFVSLLLLNIVAAASYRQIDTKSFKIIYNTNQADLANYYATNIEAWGDEVFDLYKYRPLVPIYVYLDDSTDIINSFAYSNTIYMFPSSNTSFTEGGVDWIEPVFKHELTHSVTLMHNTPLWLFYSFNNLKLIAIPSWFLEGTAVVTESYLNPYKNLGGRGFSERNFAAERYLSNNDINKNFFYDGRSPYLDGASFLMFYIATYGMDNYVAAYKKYTAGFLIPFFNLPITIFAKQVKLSYTELLSEWSTYLKTKYAITNNNSTAYTKIANNNYAIMVIIDSKDDGILFYGSKKSFIDGGFYPGVFYYNAKDMSVKRVATLNTNAGPSLEPFITYNKQDNSFLYSKITPNQLIGTSKSKVYKHNNSYIPDLTVAGNQTVAAINTKYGVLQLQRVAEKMQLKLGQEIIIAAASNLIINSLKASSSNEDEVFFEAGTIDSSDIYIYKLNLKSRQLSKLIKGYQPYEYKNSVYFTFANPSKNERYNIYSYNLNTRVVTQITNHTYGAFNPIVNEGGLYFITPNHIKSVGAVNGLEFLPKNQWLNKPLDAAAFTVPSLITKKASFIGDTKQIVPTSKPVRLYHYNLQRVLVIYDGKALSTTIAFESLNKNNVIYIGQQEFSYRNIISKYFPDDEDYIKNSFYGKFSFQPHHIVSTAMLALPPLFELDANYYNKEFYQYKATLRPLLIAENNLVPNVLGSGSIDNYQNSRSGVLLSWSNVPLMVTYNYEIRKKQNLAYHSVDTQLSILSVNATFSRKSLNLSTNPLAVGVESVEDTKNDDPAVVYLPATNKLISAKLERKFTFNAYIGRKNGLFGVSKINIVPLVAYVWAQARHLTGLEYDKSNNLYVKVPSHYYYRTLFYALRTETNISFYEKLEVGLNLTFYVRKNYTVIDNYNYQANLNFKKANISGAYFSVSIKF